ncbi:MAG: hypothetical protein Q8O37_02125 [Sulfuricellaceae bacterium]|nr:hypothetical protein [Sulfuricellaceae bacterium]
MKKLNVIALAVFLSQTAQAAPLEKCVGDDGRVYYGDSIPPEVLAKCRSSSEVTKSGLVKGTTRPMTDEERKAAEVDAAKKKENDKIAAEQKRRDSALIDTYSRVEEIDVARDRNLQATQVRIDSYQASTKSGQANLAKLRAQADNLLKQKKPVPPSLEIEIKSVEASTKRDQDALDKARKEAETTTARYEAEKKRFREIKGLAPKP